MQPVNIEYLQDIADMNQYGKTLTPANTYYRTVWADSLGEAMKQAERYANKGFKLIQITRKE